MENLDATFSMHGRGSDHPLRESATATWAGMSGSMSSGMTRAMACVPRGMDGCGMGDCKTYVLKEGRDAGSECGCCSLARLAMQR